MPDDALMRNSLAYRKNEAAILRGEVPEKYTRLLPYINGDSILEFGSAEGVLALLLARQGKTVTALEMRKERHDAAVRLYDRWSIQAPIGGAVSFVNGAIGDNLHLLDGIDTVVAVRVIYYLRDDIDRIFAAIGEKVPNVVLCGNRGRAARWRDCIPDDPGGPVHFYASSEGMRALLIRHGYAIATEEIDGDPIVVGRKDV